LVQNVIFVFYNGKVVDWRVKRVVESGNQQIEMLSFDTFTDPLNASQAAQILQIISQGVEAKDLTSITLPW